jgi:hypothetical protein
MDFKQLRSACASIMKRIKCVRLFVGLVVVTLPVAAFPWSLFNSDASKYRDECRAKCIEDSFGKAGAREIELRCSSKCDSLPINPKREWAAYDRCVSLTTKDIERAMACHDRSGNLINTTHDCLTAKVNAEVFVGWRPGSSTSQIVNEKCDEPKNPRPK